MDKCTTEVRRQYWKGIIAQCQARPEGQTAKAWLEENQICEQTYYLWQRRIRQEAFEEMNPAASSVPVIQQENEVTFAEVPMPPTRRNDNQIYNENVTITPAAVIKTVNMTIALSSDISDHLLSRIIQEVSHA
jgi:putative transposase